MPAVESRYARALLDCAETAGQADARETALDELCLAMDTPEAREFFASPVVPAAAKQRATDELLGEGDPVFRNFIRLLIDKRRLGLLPAIAEQYRAQKRELRGMLRIVVRSAFRLGQEQLDKIRERYREQYGAHDAEIVEFTEPALLGGVCVQIGDVRIDDTLKTRLSRLHKQMKQGVQP